MNIIPLNSHTTLYISDWYTVNINLLSHSFCISYATSSIFLFVLNKTHYRCTFIVGTCWHRRGVVHEHAHPCRTKERRWGPRIRCWWREGCARTGPSTCRPLCTRSSDRATSDRLQTLLIANGDGRAIPSLIMGSMVRVMPARRVPYPLLSRGVEDHYGTILL